MTPLRRMLLAVLGVLLAALAVTGLYITQPVLPPRGESRNAPAADARRLRAHVGKISAEFSPRSFDRPDNLDRAADYIRGELRRSSARVTDQPLVFEGRSYRNVIASFGPAEGERIVVGAHYDAFGDFSGADDNASGVAALLELSRLLAAVGPKIGIDLVAFTLEEPPAFGSPGMGSAVHAASLRRAGVGVRLMICLEMLGCFSDRPGSQAFPTPILKLFYPGTGDFIAVVGRIGQGRVTRRTKTAMRRGSDLPVHSINGPRFLPGVDLSDHASYWDAGFPAVMITDTAFYRNPRYHTAEDTPETLDYARLAEVVRGLFTAILDLAG
jgi:Zn-dependent M28 family amino/carboxypeptidase